MVLTLDHWHPATMTSTFALRAPPSEWTWTNTASESKAAHQPAPQGTDRPPPRDSFAGNFGFVDPNASSPSKKDLSFTHGASSLSSTLYPSPGAVHHVSDNPFFQTARHDGTGSMNPSECSMHDFFPNGSSASPHEPADAASTSWWMNALDHATFSPSHPDYPTFPDFETSDLPSHLSLPQTVGMDPAAFLNGEVTDSAESDATDSLIGSRKSRSTQPTEYSPVFRGQIGLSKDVPHSNVPCQTSVLTRKLTDVRVEDWSECVRPRPSSPLDLHSRLTFSFLAQTDEFALVTTMKGSIIYASSGSSATLDHDAGSLIGSSLSQLCHPKDFQAVLRELKEARIGLDSRGRPGSVVDVLFRGKRRSGDYVWLEASGRVVAEETRSRKIAILLLRRTSVPRLDWQSIQAADGLGGSEFWGRVTRHGMILQLSSDVAQVLDFQSEDLLGTTLKQLSPVEDWRVVDEAIKTAFEGKAARLEHRLLDRRMTEVEVVTDFYPVGSDKEEIIVCQINTLASDDVRSSASSFKDETRARSPAPGGSGSSFILRPNQAEMAEATKTRPRRTNERFSCIPSAFHALSSGNSRPQSGSLLADLGGRSPSDDAPNHHIAYQNAAMLNKHLKEELHALEAARDRVRVASVQVDDHRQVSPTMVQDVRGHEGLDDDDVKEGADPSLTDALGGQVPFHAAAADPDYPALPLEQPGEVPEVDMACLRSAKVCLNCGTSDTPEWRTAPGGRRELCNVRPSHLPGLILLD